MFGLFGCDKAPQYHIICDGDKTVFANLKQSYTAGEAVELYYRFVATDTDYAFYLDDEKLSTDYDEAHGYILRFTMPDHDVKLRVESRNSMVYIPRTPDVAEGEILVDYYCAASATDGGDDHIEYVLYRYTDDEAKLSVFRRDEGEPETEEKYIVPYTAVEECYALIEQYRFDEWAKLSDPVSIDGAKKVLRYCTLDGGSIRVSTEAMPDGGEEQIDAVGDVIAAYIRDGYRAE